MQGGAIESPGPEAEALGVHLELHQYYQGIILNESEGAADPPGDGEQLTRFVSAMPNLPNEEALGHSQEQVDGPDQSSNWDLEKAQIFEEAQEDSA